jgi:hypothetical protein
MRFSFLRSATQNRALTDQLQRSPQETRRRGGGTAHAPRVSLAFLLSVGVAHRRPGLSGAPPAASRVSHMSQGTSQKSEDHLRCASYKVYYVNYEME